MPVSMPAEPGRSASQPSGFDGGCRSVTTDMVSDLRSPALGEIKMEAHSVLSSLASDPSGVRLADGQKTASSRSTRSRAAQWVDGRSMRTYPATSASVQVAAG
jgi:hypothetical protein